MACIAPWATRSPYLKQQTMACRGMSLRRRRTGYLADYTAYVQSWLSRLENEVLWHAESAERYEYEAENERLWGRYRSAAGCRDQAEEERAHLEASVRQRDEVARIAALPDDALAAHARANGWRIQEPIAVMLQKWNAAHR